MSNICTQNRRPAAFTTLVGNRIIKPINNKIKWHIVNFTNDTSKYKTILSFFRAFKIIEPHFGGIEFEPTSDIKEAQITLRFADSNGAGAQPPEPFGAAVLAYAYALRGDVWFNDRWKWDEMHSTKTNTWMLAKIAVHEIFHTLNIGHTDEPGDIMNGSAKNDGIINITQDTQAAIRHLYGDYFRKPVPERNGLMGSMTNIRLNHTRIGLRNYCILHGLKTSGYKSALVKRIAAHLHLD